jgi:tRNA-specific 2-thiouridylase
MYVCSKNISDNTVTLGFENDLFTKSLTANNINLIAYDKIDKPIRLKARVRYKQEEQWATVSQLTDDRLLVEFDQPQRAITKGQAVVLYDGDIVVGGGVIE